MVLSWSIRLLRTPYLYVLIRYKQYMLQELYRYSWGLCEGCGGTDFIPLFNNETHYFNRCLDCGKMNLRRHQECRGHYRPTADSKGGDCVSCWGVIEDAK
jgi:hypothetical protein